MFYFFALLPWRANLVKVHDAGHLGSVSQSTLAVGARYFNIDDSFSRHNSKRLTGLTLCLSLSTDCRRLFISDCCLPTGVIKF